MFYQTTNVILVLEVALVTGLPKSLGIPWSAVKMLLNYFCLLPQPTDRHCQPHSYSFCLFKMSVHSTAYVWSLNHFLLTGPGTRRPSSHFQKFQGNSFSITKCGQHSETHKERLGHPSNQCSWELQRRIPAGACPGNVFDSTTCMHTDIGLSAVNVHFFFFFDMSTLQIA